jgi:hypothetical protein
MDLARLRRRCEARLRSLELPVPFDVRAFAEGLAHRRGRPIVLQPQSRAGGCTGLWVATPAADVVFFEAETSPLHQEHIILHELCHLLLEHAPGGVPTAGPAGLFPDVGPESVRRMLQRSGYSTEDDREAEFLASMILAKAIRGGSRGTEPPAAPADPVAAGVLARLEASLDGAPRGQR